MIRLRMKFKPALIAGKSEERVYLYDDGVWEWLHICHSKEPLNDAVLLLVENKHIKTGREYKLVPIKNNKKADNSFVMHFDNVEDLLAMTSSCISEAGYTEIISDFETDFRTSPAAFVNKNFEVLASEPLIPCFESKVKAKFMQAYIHWFTIAYDESKPLATVYFPQKRQKGNGFSVTVHESSKVSKIIWKDDKQGLFHEIVNSVVLPTVAPIFEQAQFESMARLAAKKLRSEKRHYIDLDNS